MKSTQAWAGNKPALIFLAASESFFNAPYIFDYLNFLKNPDLVSEYLPLPSFSEWISIYEDNSLISKLIKKLKDQGDYGEKIGEILEGIFTIEHNPLLKERLTKIFQRIEQDAKLRKKYTAHAVEFSKELMNLSHSAMEDDISKKGNVFGTNLKNDLKTQPELCFCLKVLIPSILLYQKNPQELFNEAREGRIDSLSKLLVIDKEILKDRVIFSFFSRVAMKENDLDYNLVTKAFRKTPADMVTIRKIKVALARFIVDLSIFLGKRLSINEMRALFDAIEKDRTADDTAIDEEGLYDSEDSFYKAVMRHPGYESIFRKNRTK